VYLGSTLQVKDRAQSPCQAHLNPNILKKLNPQPKNPLMLIGQLRGVWVDPLKKNKGVAQILWTGIQSKGKNKAVVYFKEALVSTFKLQSSTLPEGTLIEISGDFKHLYEAAARLETQELETQGLETQEVQNHDKEGSEKAPVTGKNPLSTERRVNDKKEPHKNKGRVPMGNLTQDLSSQDPFFQESSLSGNGEAYGFGAHNSSLGNEENSHSSSRGHSRNPRGSSALGGNRNSFQLPPYGVPSQGMPVHGKSSQGSFSSVPIGPSTQGDPLAHGVGEGDKKDDGEKGKEGDPSLDPTLKEGLPREGVLGEGLHRDGIDPLGLRPEKIKKEEAEIPIVTQVTSKGCTPRVDWDQNRVIIQTRSLSHQGEMLISETPCGDSHKWFAIKKDFQVCKDHVDRVARVAYSQYQRYWIHKGEKIYLDSVCQKEENKAHPFLESQENCSHKVDLDKNLAYPQVETFYYDRNNGRQIVKACHPVPHVSLPIKWVRKGCAPLHLFEKNYSVIQKRQIFMDKGVEHEVSPCQKTPETVPHTYVKSDCKNVFVGGKLQAFGKRQIEIGGKKTLISQDCEPLDPSTLETTEEGCEGQWDHDLEGRQSYGKVRWYYKKGGRAVFLTRCVRGSQSYPHLLDIFSYEHDDRNKVSKPVYKVSVKIGGKEMYLMTITETDPSRFVKHVHEKNLSYVSRAGVYNDRCSAWAGTSSLPATSTMEQWLRPDGSTYLVF
jgi:hypothetical protein